MNPTVITYVGLAVAASILVWSSVTLVQHTRAHKKPPAGEPDPWIIIRPLASSEEEDELLEEEPNPLLDAYLRGQQSGYCFKSKKPQ
ncbi:MAG TPA: hypothetical protein VL485_11750 [Ktedonobacteraceae bacterium]|jgi:hypothetical protein|nr:hypothetical protein [Ktedonobacteraceae bacterium]